ncbi:hypothetical protein CHS0354_027176 [Potamilus streckersoni]|uniref:Bromo domain-containing protein n=1 Tax=Potamilus streckersoni TaxID=2493646 RepID=A0AAE0TJB7_9BIVA|nr:hypothetical protein CHS0354_027176 [Potamilus streckersoni]
MGKKHKKHHKSEKKAIDSYDDERPEKEPLKLVLKVGVPDPSPDPFRQSPAHEEKRHKHKKKKKKKSSDKDKYRHKHDEEIRRKRDRDYLDDVSISQEDEAEEEADEPTRKRTLLDLDDDTTRDSEEIPHREHRSAAVKEDEHGILKQCLLYIQKNLQKKDVNGFFAYPVNDVIAPGYSSIIQHPMDFSTMLSKIENDEYRSVLEYKKDFVLMCNNAMTYNRPETIYYKEAKKLLHSGMKLLSKEKLLNMKRNLVFMGSITMEELGIDEPDDTNAVMEAIAEEERQIKQREKERKNLGRFEAIPDNMSAEEILAQAQAAAKDAADMLTLRKPQNVLSFLRRREDGTTSLTILNPENEGIVSETEKVVSLGSLVGKLTTGTGCITGFKEDKRNKVSAVNYLNYGPFSSHAPMYDTSFANVTKDESDLLYSTYGDESGVQYAKSVMKFVEDAGECAIKIVDSLLDALTNKEHTKTMKILAQKEEELRKSEEQVSEKEEKNYQHFDSTRFSEKNVEDVIGGMQDKLDHTASLLNELQESQHQRLSQKPPLHLAHVPGPSDKEMQLAGQVTKELTNLVKTVTPKDIISLRGIHKAMGISLSPIEAHTDVAEDDSQLNSSQNDDSPSTTDSQSQEEGTDLNGLFSNEMEDYD